MFATRHKIHLGVASLIMTWSVSRVLHFEIKAVDYLLVPISVVGVYGLNRLTDEVEDSVNCPEDLADAKSHRGFLKSFYWFGIAMLLCELVINKDPAPLLVFIVYVIAFLYSSQVRVANHQLRLKNWFVTKMVSVASGWTIWTVLYPAFHARLELTWELSLSAVIVFAEIALLQIIGDLRDVDGDRLAGISTLPVRWSYVSAIRMLRASSWIPSLLILGGIAFEILSKTWVLLLVDSIFCTVFLLLMPASSWRNRRSFDLFLVARGSVLLVIGIVAAGNSVLVHS